MSLEELTRVEQAAWMELEAAEQAVVETEQALQALLQAVEDARWRVMAATNHSNRARRPHLTLVERCARSTREP